MQQFFYYNDMFIQNATCFDSKGHQARINKKEGSQIP